MKAERGAVTLVTTSEDATNRHTFRSTSIMVRPPTTRTDLTNITAATEMMSYASDASSATQTTSRLCMYITSQSKALSSIPALKLVNHARHELHKRNWGHSPAAHRLYPFHASHIPAPGTKARTPGCPEIAKTGSPFSPSPCGSEFRCLPCK